MVSKHRQSNCLSDTAMHSDETKTLIHRTNFEMSKMLIYSTDPKRLIFPCAACSLCPMLLTEVHSSENFVSFRTFLLWRFSRSKTAVDKLHYNHKIQPITNKSLRNLTCFPGCQAGGLMDANDSLN